MKNYPKFVRVIKCIWTVLFPFKCFVMCLYKMYLTIASNFTLTSRLLLHIRYIYNRFLNHYQSQCCRWKLLQHAAYCCNFLQFYGIDTLCNMKHFSSRMSNFLTSLRKAKRMVSVIDSSHAGAAVDATGTRSSAFRAHLYSSYDGIWGLLMWALSSTKVANAAHLRWEWVQFQ